LAASSPDTKKQERRLGASPPDYRHGYSGCKDSGKQQVIHRQSETTTKGGQHRERKQLTLSAGRRVRIYSKPGIVFQPAQGRCCDYRDAALDRWTDSQCDEAASGTVQRLASLVEMTDWLFLAPDASRAG
jgi:hypothetical protein